MIQKIKIGGVWVEVPSATKENVGSVLDTFTPSTPLETDYLILGGKKKTLLSAVVTFLKTKFQVKLTAGTNVTIDNTDPNNPIISTTGGGGGIDYSVDIEADKLSTTKVSAIKTFYDWAIGKFAALAHSHTYSSLSGLPSLFSGAWADITGKPTFFSGNYNDLTDKPAPVDISGKENTGVAATLIANLSNITTIAASAGAATYPLELNKQVVISGTLPNGVNSTLTLPALVAGKTNESIVHFATNATAAPTLVYSGFTPLWLGGTAITMKINKQYTIVFEQINGVVKASFGEY